MMNKALAYLRSIADGLLQPRKKQRVTEHESDGSSTRQLLQADTPFDLLGVPDSGLMNIISFLDRKEQLVLFQTSKACARLVLNFHSKAASRTTCTVSKSTTWRGLRQVLSWIQTPVRLTFQPHKLTDCKVVTAYDIFLSTDSVPSSMQQAIYNKWNFSCVTGVDVSAPGNKLRSLVPRVIAVTCTNLQSCCTSVAGFIGSFPNNMQELHPCQNLKQLVICDEQALTSTLSLMNPVPHHSTAELVAAFPNLESLELIDAVLPFVMQAFSQQVSSLKLRIRSEAEAALLQPYSKLHTLTFADHPYANDLLQLPLPAITENLSTLKFYGEYFNDSFFEQLLQLPSLEYLTVTDMSDLSRDFSDHAFNRQVSLEMHGTYQHLQFFAKLPIKSIKQCVFTSPTLEFHLPDPDNADSMAIASKIARNIADTDVRICSEHTIKWVVPKTANDTEAAEIFAVVAKTIPPTEQCVLGAITHRPALLAAVLHWATPRTERICTPLTPETSTPHLWHLLQQFPYLWAICLMPDDEQTVGKEQLLAQVCDVICCAAKHLIVPVLKPGRCMTFWTTPSTPIYDDPKAHADMAFEMLKESLPDSVKIDPKYIEADDSYWEVTLEKLDANSNVADQSDAANA